MLSYKRMEDKERIGSDLANKPFSDFTFFNRLSSDKALNAAFMKMQEIYVFDERDKVEHEKLIEKIGSLHEVLLNLDEGLR